MPAPGVERRRSVRNGGRPDNGKDAGGRPRAAHGWEPPRIRGRDDVLALVRNSLRRLENRHGPEVIVIEGVPGSGKTRLLDEVCVLARTAGMHAFKGGGDPEGQLAPMAPLLDALLATEAPVLDRSALRAGATSTDQRFWLLREIQDRLERAALEQPLVIVVDDVQWCDEATLAALRALPERLSGHAVMWVLASRGEAPDHVEQTLGRLKEAGAAAVSLTPLDSGAVADVVADLLSATPGPDVLSAARGAEGRPLLLVELVRGLREEGLIVMEGDRARLVGGRIPLRFRESVDQRLQQVSPTAQELVRVASALGRETPIGQLAEMMDRKPAELHPAVREALGSDLMVGDGVHLRFRHDLIREAVKAGIPTTVRRLLRRRAAELQLRHGVPEVEVALLVAENAEPGDRWAIDVLRRAAAELSSVEPHMAAEISRSALDLTHDGTAERGLLLAETVHLLWQSGRAAEARTMGSKALEGLLESEAEGRIRLGLAMASSRHSFTEAVRQCRDGLSLPTLSPGLRARLLAMLCVALASSGEVQAAERTLRPALHAAREAQNLSAEASVLSIESVVRFYHFDMDLALRRIDESLEIASRLDGPALSLPHLWRSMLLSAVGEADRAVELVDTQLRQALTDGEADLTRMLLMTRCRLLLDAGRLSDARAEAEAVLSMVDELGPGDFVDATARYTLGRVARHRGDPAGVRAAAEHARRMLGDDSVLMRNTGAWLGALSADATGDLEAVDHCTRYAAESFERLGPALAGPEDPTDQALYVRITLRAGLRDRAEAATRAAERRAAAGPRYPVLAAAAAHARALLTGDVPLLRRTVDLLESSSHRIARASVLEDLGVALAGEGDAEAVGRLDQALELYLEAGADRDVDRVRRRLREIGVRRGSSEGERRFGLTASELKVVRLIAQGATNRTAAEALFLSPHTVSSHLRHAFAKLGVNSRVELARVFAELEDEDRSGPAG
ncbi:helix-turn-helix transcriptional regulator [Streptomyces sp. NBC_00316]|uniref:helix-turn-helix transcriptional regulator n=1 Tax=Streptomyces sp. NBC_00316 TaxID=2975710 RepID=UPI002E2D63B6|nr:AAA family ATPase [Streptomyces sp. NBC_00316]